MALGKSYINKIDNLQDKIRNNKSDIEDCWNTFQYVSKQMDQWAGDTEVGRDVQEQCIKLSDQLENTINNIENLLNKIEDFLQRQKEINNRTE